MKSSVISLSRFYSKNSFYLLCYYLIAVVLLFSGISKIIDPLPLIETLESLQIFPEELLLLIATLLPIIEIIAGAMLILKTNAKIALISSTILFTVFFVFAFYGYVVGLTNDCGCFGSLYESSFGIEMIIRNIIVLLISILLNFNI